MGVVVVVVVVVVCLCSIVLYDVGVCDVVVVGYVVVVLPALAGVAALAAE